MDADDRMVAGALLVRGKRTASMATLMGGGALLLSFVPHTGVLLPAGVYGVCSFVPLVCGAVAVVGAGASARTFAGQPAGVAEALRARGVTGILLRAGLGAVLGAVAATSGLIALLSLELVQVTF